MDCEEIWTSFKQAFVGKNPCDVPPEAYDPLIRTVIQDPACNRVKTLLYYYYFFFLSYSTVYLGSNDYISHTMQMMYCRCYSGAKLKT